MRQEDLSWLLIKEVAVARNPNPDVPIFSIGKRRWQILLNEASHRALSYKIHPHTLRHSFATHLYGKGVEIEHIKELLGHKDISSTMIYTHISPKIIEDKYSEAINF